MSSDSGSSSDARSLLGKLLEGDWVSQLFALALFVDLYLVLCQQIPLSQLTAAQLAAIPAGQIMTVFLSYVLFSRWLVPSLRWGLQWALRYWPDSPLHQREGVRTNDLLSYALRKKNSVAYQEYQAHKDAGKQQDAFAVTLWALCLMLLTNALVGFWLPTLFNKLWQMMQYYGVNSTVLKGLSFIAACFVLSLMRMSLTSHDDSKIYSLPEDIAQKIRGKTPMQQALDAVNVPPYRQRATDDRDPVM